jgi:hypothetical protein
MNERRCWPPLRAARRSVLVTAVAGLNACYVWQPAVLDPTHEFLNGDARLTRSDGAAVVVCGPRLVGDSIVATATRTVTPVVIPRADVRRIEVRRLSGGRTAAVGAILMAAHLAVTWGVRDSSVDTVP